MTTTRTWALTIVAVLGTVGCSRPRSVIMVDEKDPEMEAAIAEARSHVAEFVAALQSPQPGDKFFSVTLR